jgi:hypothetical protein
MSWQASVDYAIAVGADRTVDPVREGYGWRVIADPTFWAKWQRDKAGMKAAGYRVVRSDEGHYLVSFNPPKVAKAA